MKDETAFFTLKKELPSCKIGDMVIISRGGMYKDSLIINGLIMDIDGENYPDWFEPVTESERIKMCHDDIKAECLKRGVKYEDFLKELNSANKCII